MIELLMSDVAILVFTSVGLAVTAASIVRDARSQHQRAAIVTVPVPLLREKPARRRKLAA